MRWAGPEIGADTVSILSDVLGYQADSIDTLLAQGVMHAPRPVRPEP